MAKLPFMMGRYKWLVKVLSVGAECKGEDPNAGHKETTSTKQHNTTVDNGSLTKKCFDKKVVNNISKKPRFHIEEHKVFNDPIHGHMALHPVLVKIIDTPEFQRLRNIKQLGGIYFVYPGASHNRFEHSIGVAHLAGELAKALKMKQEKEIEQLEDSKKLTLLMESTSEELEKLKLHMLMTEDLEMLENFKKLEKFDDKELEEFKKCKPVEFINFEKMNQLKKFGPEDLKKLNESKESLISDQDVLCVQIAGLCHDLGHGPFSHFFDGMFMDAIKTDEQGEADNEEWTHEEASIEMFNHLLVQNGLKEEMAKYGLKVDGNDETDLLFIKEMINGPLNPAQDKKPQNDAAQDNGPQNNDASKKWPYKGRDEKKSFLYEIVSNKKTGIDVDKFDYLARDCQQLGIPNSFDHQRFIMFARVCDVKEDGRKHICSRDKESANLYDIFQQRVSIHRKACQHKIKMAVEIMIKDALILADKDPEITIKGSGDEMLSISKAKGDMVAYTKLTDQVIETVLNSSSDSLKEAREILQRVMTRDLYRCVGQAKKKSEKNVFSYVLTWFKELLKYIQVDGKDRDEVTDKKKKKKQFKTTKKDLEEKLSERFPGDKFEIIDATLDYGMENVDPISKAFSYSKDNPDEGKRIVKSEVFSVLPDWFSDEILRVYWKNPKGLNDEEIKKREVKFKEFFKGWCKNNGYKDLQG